MLEIRKTEEFKAWLDALNDLMGRAKIQARIKRLAEGNQGNVKSVGSKVFEMKIDFGPGYSTGFITQNKRIWLTFSLSEVAKELRLRMFRSLNFWLKICKE